MGDDDRVPVGGRSPRQEAVALLLHEIRLVGDEDPGVRVQRQELARGLREAVARHHQHGLVDQAKPTLLHDRGRDRERLQEVSNAMKGVVVDQHGAEQRLLRFDVVRRLTIEWSFQRFSV